MSLLTVYTRWRRGRRGGGGRTVRRPVVVTVEDIRTAGVERGKGGGEKAVGNTTHIIQALGGDTPLRLGDYFLGLMRLIY